MLSVVGLVVLGRLLQSANAEFGPVGDGNHVMIDEGETLVAYRSNCDPTADGVQDICYPLDPDMEMCANKCSSHSSCGSFAFCPGDPNHAVNFPRCFLKSKQVDMAVVSHKSLYPHGGDCNTYKKDGTRLHPDDGMVARNEGNDVYSFRPNCGACDPAITGCETDGEATCTAMVPTLDQCKSECQKRPACKSFAFCTGASDVGFARCFLKTGDFNTVPHAEKFPASPGDCKSYYPKEAGNCRSLKDYYKDQKCCGNPSQTLNFNIPQKFN